MTTLTVDADQITITERCVHGADGLTYCCPDLGSRSAVIVMDGEINPMRTVMGPEANIIPPEQVRRLTEPCQTCGGHPWSLRLICCGHEDEPAPGRTSWDEINAIRNSYIEAEGHDRQAIIVACPDCHKSKPTFTLHQRCEHLVMRQASNSQPICIRCLDAGVIDLGDGWTITEVLPMHDGGTKLDTYPPDAFYWTKGEGWWRDSQFDKIVTMPPAAKPGMFVVFAEQETP